MSAELNVLIEESVSLLREMIGIASPSFEEAEVCNFICKWMSSKGLEPERIGDNLICQIINNPDYETLMLCAHIDTVSPASDYEFDPFHPDLNQATEIVSKIRGENLAGDMVIPGLGSNDDGGSVVSMIAAFRYFNSNTSLLGNKNLTLVLSCQEERSGEGGMRTLWGNRLSHIKHAIIGEPTGMKAAISERGLLVIDGVAEGVSGHAARNEGVNAIYIAMEDIEQLRNYEFSKVSPVMGKVHLNVTQINAGSAHNVIPDKCSFVVDIRPTEQYSNEEIFNSLQEICSSKLKARNLLNSSSCTFAGSAHFAAVKTCGIETFSSPTTSDWMRISCDAIKMGPGDSARSHKKNEYVLKSEISEGIRTYIKYIETITL